MLAIENNIISLPPNCSHALQPLDVGVFKKLKVEWKKILKQWFRETRLSSVDKAVFPGLLNRLWHTLSADDAVAGFRGSGIVPLELEKMKQQIVLPNEMGSPVRNENSVSNPVALNSAMKKAVRSVHAPVQSKESEEILNNKARKRAQVQVKTGEVVTSETCVRRLLEEQEKRNAKQKNTKKTQKKS